MKFFKPKQANAGEATPAPLALKLAALAAVLLFFTGAGAYASKGSVSRHAQNEVIEVLDSGTDKRLGTLCMTGYEILLTAEVRRSRTNEDGKEEYYTATYRIVQIYYKQNGLKLSSDPAVNFRVWDGDYTAVFADKITPKLNYHPIEKQGQSSIIVALERQNKFLYISFYYPKKILIPTARIKLNFDGNAPSPVERYTVAPSGEKDEIQLKDEEIHSLRDELQGVAAEMRGMEEEIQALEAQARKKDAALRDKDAALDRLQARNKSERIAFGIFVCVAIAIFVFHKSRAKKKIRQDSDT